MHVFVTGGAGHTGCNFLRLYLSDNLSNQATVLIRKSTDRSYLPDGFGERLNLVYGDLREEGVEELMRGVDVVLHIAHQTLCPEVIETAVRANVDRVFFVTTTGVFSKFNDLASDYRAIEEKIRRSQLNWTILRPTMIYGSERDVNVHKLLQYVDKHAVFPIFGDGKGLMQPVYVEDLAHGMLQGLQNPEKTAMKEYNLPGRSPLTYNEIVQTAIDGLGRKTKTFHIPHSLSLVLSTTSEKLLGNRSPVKSEQVRRLSEDKAFSWTTAKDDFGYNPRPFAVGIANEIARLRQIGLLASG